MQSAFEFINAFRNQTRVNTSIKRPLFKYSLGSLLKQVLL